MHPRHLWVLSFVLAAACVAKQAENDDDDGATGAATDGSGGSTHAPSGATGGSVASGGPPPSCNDLFADPCGACLEGACCEALAACAAAPGCLECVTGRGSANCSSEPVASALLSCASAACSELCFDASGSGGSGGAPFTGIGSTVAQCQGTGALYGTVNNEMPSVQSGFAAVINSAMNVFLYDRPYISAVNLPGDPGEYKMRLLFGDPISNSEYGGIMAVSKWDSNQQLWVDLSTPTYTVVITLYDYQVVDPTGLMCNGKLVGKAEALFDTIDLVIATFEVPILTSSFPSN